jgi:hypothetical protein
MGRIATYWVQTEKARISEDSGLFFAKQESITRSIYCHDYIRNSA